MLQRNVMRNRDKWMAAEAPNSTLPSEGRRASHRMRRQAKRYACQMGFHRRASVIMIGHRALSECGFCGADLVRSRRGWRELRADELPEGWTPKPPTQRMSRLWLVVFALVLMVAIVLIRKFALHR